MEDKIQLACSECGISANVLTCIKKYGQRPNKLCFTVSTSRVGICDFCKRIKDDDGEPLIVTPVRDFFYPDFSLLPNKLNTIVLADGKECENKSILEGWDEDFDIMMCGTHSPNGLKTLLKNILDKSLQAQREKDARIARNYIPCCSRRPTAGDEIADIILNQNDNE